MKQKTEAQKKATKQYREVRKAYAIGIQLHAIAEIVAKLEGMTFNDAYDLVWDIVNN